MPLTGQERDSYRARFNKAAVAVIQGELLELTYVKGTKEFRLPGKRGKISGFTRSSRLRMLRTIAKVDWSRVGASLFITLTYPDSRRDRSSCERNRDRYLFLRSMENYLQRKVGCLWRLEWKARKSGKAKGSVVPHAHLIVFNCRFIPWREIRKWWRDALAVDGHLATDVRRIVGGKSVAMYVSKYCSKLPDATSLDYASYLNNPGRHWGINRRDLIPWCERWVVRLGEKRQIQLCENAACMTFPFFNRDVDQGFSLFGKKAVAVIAEICRTDLDDKIGPR